ncbi:hypothetical protein WKW50_16325 [Ochrobactrum sp. GPK 3]
MKIVDITPSLAINPDFVADVNADYRDQIITITMADGRTHTMKPGWGESMVKTHDDILKKIRGQY